MSKRYWLQLLEHLQISSNKLWSELSKKEIYKLIADCNQASFRVQGKGIFKEEFVTCGGISRKEIDFKTMMSKKQKKLFATGELLDIDGITGGFNFQNAWTSAYLVAHAIQSK
jgi:predicted flavoprotein YhiN